MKKIVVVGSLIVDIAAYAPRFPIEGETVLGSHVKFGPGGKGNNQATAAARAGGDVTMISKMGNDFLRSVLTDHYDREGMTKKYLYVSETAETGSALIEVLEGSAQNRIIVVKGANGEITRDEVRAAEAEFAGCDVFLTQLESSLESIEEGKALAQKYGKPIVMNPAPFQEVPSDMFRGVQYLTPNETEAEYFSGVKVETPDDMRRAADALRKLGAENVIITLGSQGAFYSNGDIWFLVPALKMPAVDTTGAGDAFNGGLAVAIAEGMPMKTAIQFACCVAGISVTGKGSAPSMPKRAEVDALMKTGYGISPAGGTI